jgi:UDP-N-acetylglucosamine--N-acetylmuramyl-(pentapeptide) pyrophosphoryl-undecaprenol N-acetylglucosamine transferase
VFIGNIKSIEANVVPQEGFEFKGLNICGWDRTWIGIIRFFGRLICGIYKAYKYLNEVKPDVILGTGGYVCVPVILVGKIKGIKTILHEQNALPGLAVRLLANIVNVVAISLQETSKYLPDKKIVLTGNPIREDIGKIKKEVGIERFGLDKNKLTLVVFGGSRGSRSINLAILKMLKDEPEIVENLQIIWITGKNDYPWIYKEAERYRGKCYIVDYINDIATAYAAADVVVCRSGATTVAEVIACRLPVVMIPYPMATDNHQEKNARVLEEYGVGIVISDDELPSGMLTKVVKGLVNNPEKIHMMRQNYQNVDIYGDGAVEKITELIIQDKMFG